MKVAIFHNFLDNIGGAEKLVLTLARELQADIYTTNIDREKIRRMGFDSKNIYSIGTVPTNAPYRQQLTVWRFRLLNLKKKYDYFIIGGDWAFSAAFNNHPVVWYIHSPARELWDLYEYTKKRSVPWYARWFFDLWVWYNRHESRAALQHIQHVVCNSSITKQRIEKYLHRSSDVIYPPVDTKKYKYIANDGFWLSVNRLVSHKRIELQLEAFARMPEKKLILIGSYEQSRHFLAYRDYVVRIKPSNVELRSWVDEAELIELYGRCTGVITTSLEEDFGMTAIEAMASGKPVITPDEGGYRESILQNKTGIRIQHITVDSLIDAINLVENDSTIYKDACLKRAKDFDTTEFIRNIRTLLPS